jgi:arylsulfatase
MEHEGNRGVIDGEWKLVALQGQPWELYHLARDPGEMQNLAAQHPERASALSAAWDEWAARCSVVRKHGAKP